MTTTTHTGWWALDVSTPTSAYTAYMEAGTDTAAAEALRRAYTKQGMAAPTITEVTVHTPRLGWTLVMGGHSWGAGASLAAAKAEFKRNGGRLAHGYAITTFDALVDFLYVDQMGRFHTMRREGAGDPGWTERQVKPRA